MATIQVEEHMRSTWEVTWWWKWKVFLRKPQGKEELEPPEAAKEKQVSTLKCEFGPDNTSVWVFMLRNDESLIYVILNDHVCCDSLTKKKKYSNCPSPHHNTEFSTVYLCTDNSLTSRGWGEQMNGKLKIVDTADTLSLFIFIFISYMNLMCDFQGTEFLRKTPFCRHRRESWVFCILVDYPLLV